MKRKMGLRYQYRTYIPSMCEPNHHGQVCQPSTIPPLDGTSHFLNSL